MSTEYTLHLSLLACPLAAQQAQLTLGKLLKKAAPGKAWWDVLQWAGKWRSARHSWVMGWHALHFSLYLLYSPVYDLFPIWEEKRINLCIHWSNIGASKVYAAVFSPALRTAALILRLCPRFGWKQLGKKITQHLHILCQRTFSCNFHFHSHMTEVINLLHFDLCSLCLSACLIVCL